MSIKRSSLRHPWLSLTDTIQNGDSFTEMGVRVFGTTFTTSNRHPRGVLIEDPDLSEIDSRRDNSRMTASKSRAIIIQGPILSTHTKSA